VASVRTVFLGDSHLARLRGSLRGFPTDVCNAAEGGACALDLLRQADAIGLQDTDVVVLSVGTNDAAPWKQLPMSAFAQALSTLLASRSPRGWVYVAPPGVVEDRLAGARDRTNTVIDAYRRAAIEFFEDVGGQVVRSDLILASLGATAFAEDGVHLNGTGNRVLVPAIESACAALR
jgi:lysophospholipase L1-like esterase